MVRDTACRSVLITVSVLLVCTALGSAQSGKRRTTGSSGRQRGPRHAASSLLPSAESR